MLRPLPVHHQRSIPVSDTGIAPIPPKAGLRKPSHGKGWLASPIKPGEQRALGKYRSKNRILKVERYLNRLAKRLEEVERRTAADPAAIAAADRMAAMAERLEQAIAACHAVDLSKTPLK